jgi:hypothetical protein
MGVRALIQAIRKILVQFSRLLFDRDKKCIQRFGRKPEGRGNLEDLRADGRIILK